MATRGRNNRSSTSPLPKLIVILGPTAVGKSSLAVKLAKIFSGEIISADSRQVYRGMNIGTGKITPKEQQGIPHHLLDVVSPKTRFDVAKYLKKSLTEKSLSELLLILKKLDPLYFQKVEKRNKRRIIRAIEIASQLGKVPPLKKKPLFETLILGLKLPSPILKKRIRQRLEKRFRQGMVNEIKTLHQQGVSWKRLEEFGLEYKWISLYLKGELSLEAMQVKLQQEIERFAKRQMTWFKKDPRIHWIRGEKEAKLLIKNFIKQ